MFSKSFRIFVLALTTGFASGLASPAWADDTEIYVGANNIGNTIVKPNILFILDSSGSMAATVPGTGKSRLDNMKEALLGLLDSVNNVNVGLMDFTDPGGPILFPVADIDADAQAIENPGATSTGTSSPDVQARMRQGSLDDGVETAYYDGTPPTNEVARSVDLGQTELAMGQVVSSTTSTVTNSVWIPVSASNADATQTGNSMDVTKKDLKFKNNTWNGVLFKDVAVPQGATITYSTVVFRSSKDESGNMDLKIYAEDRDSASVFTNGSKNISNRPRTSASVTWSVPDWQKDTWQWSPDIKNVVQEVINRPGWTEGTSDLALLLEHRGGGNERKAYAYDKGNGYVAWLYIAYQKSTTVPTERTSSTVGLRFSEITIPQGVTITEAKVQFTAAQDSVADTGNPARYIIRAEVADPVVPTDTDADLIDASDPDNITSRKKTTASVSWSPGAWTKDQKYDTVDISSVIQEVVSQTDWCGGNALLITIEPDPTDPNGDSFQRIAYSSRATGGTSSGASGTNPDAPTLTISYDHDSVPAAPGGCRVQTIQHQINLNSDDATEVGFNSYTYPFTVPTYLYSDYLTGLRFSNLSIPQGAEILEADVRMTVQIPAYQNRPITLTWQAEAIDDSPTFSSAKNDISRRNLTTASVTETPSPVWNVAGEEVVSADISTIIQEVVNRSGWKNGNALSLIVKTSSSNFAYVGMESFDGNAAAAPVLRVKIRAYGSDTVAVKTVRQRLKEIVQLIPAYNWTPIVSTLYEAVQYYRGGPVTHGKRLSHLSYVAPYTQVSHPASWTGGTLVPSGCTATMGVLDSNACTSISGSPTYISPLTGYQCQANYIVLLTDGEANHNAGEDGTDHGVNLIPSLMGSGCDSSVSSGEKCGRELATFINTKDQSSTLDGTQTIQLYTIGFNTTGLANATQFLKDLAANGGGDFYEATTASDLSDVFNSIVIDVLNRPTSFATPTLTVNAFNKLYFRNEVYFSLFEPSDKVYWKGNVKKYNLCDLVEFTSCTLGEILDTNGAAAVGADKRIKDTAQSEWSSGIDGIDVTLGGIAENMPAYATRTLFTYTGSTAPSNEALSTSINLLEVSNTNLTKALLGDAAMTDQQRTDLIEWIRGRDVDDVDGDGDTTEDRFKMEDPLHASPVAITYGGTDTNPVIKLFVASNGGFLRMIDAATGTEEWAFMPQALLSKQSDMRTNATGDHIYGLDSTPTVWAYDANNDGTIDPSAGDFVRLIFGMRRGGRNIYAIDVTPDSVLSDPTTASTMVNGGITPELMWRIEGGTGDFVQLGETWSKPVVTPIRVKTTGNNTAAKDVVIFAGGNDTLLDDQFGETSGVGGNMGNALYIVDPTDGSLILSISGPGSGADIEVPAMKYPITAEVSILDSNGDGATDRLYFGDLGGNVWRVDLGGALAPNDPDTTVVGQLADISLSAGAVSGSLDTETRRFYHGADIVQVDDSTYSNENRYDYVIIGSGNRPTPRNQTVHDRIYAFRDYLVDGLIDTNNDHLADSGTYPTLTNAECTGTGTSTPCLYNATDNALQLDNSGQPVDTTTFDADLPKIKESSGWFIDLVEPDGQYIGEKALSRPVTLAGKLFFTTYTPQADPSGDPCTLNEGDGRLYGLNILNAGALFTDWNSAGDSSAPVRADRYMSTGGGVPSEAVPVFQKEGVTIIVGGGGGATSVNPNINLPRERTYWYQE